MFSPARDVTRARLRTRYMQRAYGPVNTKYQTEQMTTITKKTKNILPREAQKEKLESRIFGKRATE